MKPNSGVTLLELAIAMAIVVVFSGGLFLALRRTDNRALNNASLQLQADMRYAQRRAVIEGRRYDMVFDRINHGYRIRTAGQPAVRNVRLANNIRIEHTSADQLTFTPRGTPTAGFSVTLLHGNQRKLITATVSGGRIHIFDIEP
jgi:prepilin-type N-terminal cleavage/methylation domain-containing protein